MDLIDYFAVEKIRLKHKPFRFIIDIESSLLSCTCGWKEDPLAKFNNIEENWWDHVIEKEFPE